MKTFTKRFISRPLLLSMIASMLLSLSGCGVDNSQVTAAVATSALATTIRDVYSEQVTVLRELLRIGVLTQAQYVTYSSGLKVKAEAEFNSLGQATYIEDNEDNSNDGEGPSPGKVTIPFVEKILRSMSWMRGYPGDKFQCDGHTDSETGDEYFCDIGPSSIVCVYGAYYFPGFGGYDTRDLIKKTDYKDAVSASHYNNAHDVDSDVIGSTKTVSAPFDVWGDESFVDEIVEGYNTLGTLSIYTLNPASVVDLNDYSQITDALNRAAASGDEGDMNTLNTWFKPCDNKYVPKVWPNLELPDVYKQETVNVVESGNGLVAQLQVKKLKFEPFDNGVKGTFLESQLSNGIVIGGKLFITKYDVAVFHGLREVGDTGTYAPIYTYQTSGTTPERYDFTGTASPYNEDITDGITALDRMVKSTSATSTADEVEQLIIDFGEGRIYRKGANPGVGNSFMSLGSSDMLSSVTVAGTAFKRLDGTPYISPSIDSGSAFTPEVKFDGSSYTQPLFVLSEYLETLYSPGIIASEPLVAYGRKVRLDDKMMKGTPVTKIEETAYVVGIGASPTAWNNREYPPLTIKDFIDLDGIYKTDGSLKSVQEMTAASNQLETVAAAHIMDTHAAGTYHTGDQTAERGDQLPQITAGKGIECVIRFGSNIIDSADDESEKFDADGNITSTQTPLYCIALYGGLYERGLFNSWINASGNAGLEQWAETAKKLGYNNYNISGAVLTEKLRGNYAFELNQDGLLSLDLDTMQRISEQNIEDRRGYGVMILRTVLLILGFILVAYVSLLLAAWALDVNMDFGLNFLEKVTFGHFVAVRSVDEMPAQNEDSTTSYVDFKGIIVRCIAFAFVAVLLITIDPVGLIIKLLTGLNFAINEISKLIFGTTTI